MSISEFQNRRWTRRKRERDRERVALSLCSSSEMSIWAAAAAANWVKCTKSGLKSPHYHYATSEMWPFQMLFESPGKSCTHDICFQARPKNGTGIKIQNNEDFCFCGLARKHVHSLDSRSGSGANFWKGHISFHADCLPWDPSTKLDFDPFIASLNNVISLKNENQGQRLISLEILVLVQLLKSNKVEPG